ncbi:MULTISPECIES: hypothetical protein [Aequorivita]|uniref:Addiction module protein n=2 Tax=Aequorivita TaxID=153265 RepID=A0AB35YQV6_9FLAO|nr:hypothetical protein [Aequorivita sp. Ant34-E75]WGF93018.1 hypothetical protein QCQ61_02225 [Aequorivita sp. Ant34-E75]
MDVKAKKLDLIEWLLHLKDEATIEKMCKLKESIDGDWYDELPDTAKASIEKGRQDYKEGKIFTSQEVNQRIKNKFPFLK